MLKKHECQISSLCMKRQEKIRCENENIIVFIRTGKNEEEKLVIDLICMNEKKNLFNFY